MTGRQSGTQRGGVSILALASIDGRGHLDATPTHVGRRVVERAGQDLIFASPARSHYR